MDDKSGTLSKFDDAKLIDIVKNYKHYGYDVIIRDVALKILSSRGIDEETLRLTGNDKNYALDTTEDIYKAYTQSSTLTIVFYFLTIGFKLTAAIMLLKDETFGTLFIVLFCISAALYFIFWTRSCLKLNDFYKSIHKQLEIAEQIGYVLIGMPLYILVFLFYRSKMKEDLKMIE